MNPQLQKFGRYSYYDPTQYMGFQLPGQSKVQTPPKSVMGIQQSIGAPTPQTSSATAPARQVTQTQAQAQTKIS